MTVFDKAFEHAHKNQPVAAPVTVQTSHALYHAPSWTSHAASGSNLLKTVFDWPCAVQAIIYVVDSSDTERIGTSAEEFHAILDEEELRDALILVYANKQASAPMRSANSNAVARRHPRPC